MTAGNDDIAAARAAWRRADAAIPRLRAVHGDLTDLLQSVVRNDPDQEAAGAVLMSLDRVPVEGDGQPDEGDRPSDDTRSEGTERGGTRALSVLADPVLEGDRTLREAFTRGRAVTPAADAVATALSEYATGDDWTAVRRAVADVVDPPEGTMAIDSTTLDQVVTLFGLAIEAVIAARKAAADRLRDTLAAAYDPGTDDPLAGLGEQPIALLPVRLETRFVDDDGSVEGDPTQLLVRVYPDQVHADAHEEQLTDDELRWGRTFWATLWYARHPDPSIVPTDPSAPYLQDRLPTDRLREHVAGIDPGSFSDTHHDRYHELKERTWRQLHERFGRERAAYVVHALAPSDDDLAETLLTRPDPPTMAGTGVLDLLREKSDRERPSDEALAETLIRDARGSGSGPRGDSDGADDATAGIDPQALSTAIANRLSTATVSGDVERIAEETVGLASADAIGGAGLAADPERLAEQLRGVDDLPSGPLSGDVPERVPALDFPRVPRKPESWTQQPRAELLPDRWIAIAEWEDPRGTTRRIAVPGAPIREPLPVAPGPESVVETEADGSAGVATPEGMEWLVDFGTAEDVGMGLRLRLSSLTGFDPERGFDRVTVLGVKASMDADEGADALADLLDAHHYTDGLELLEQGTPTNNHDHPSGHGSDDDPLESMAVECVPPLVENGDRTDGDLLARALGIASDDGEDHVFANVANADGTEQRDARHVNSALWPATLGYYLQHVAVDNDYAGNPSVGDESGAPGASNDRESLHDHLLELDAFRRHFVRYVRGRGPFPALRIGDQPYGVLPARAIGTERDLDVIEQDLLVDIERGRTSIEDLQQRGASLETLVGSGIQPDRLLAAGATPDDLLAAGARPDELVEGGVDPTTVLDASELAPGAITTDGVGLLERSQVTRDGLRSAGVPVRSLEESGISVRDLVRGQVSDQQLADAGVTTESVASALLPREAEAFGITPTALERAGVTPGALLRGELSAEQVATMDLTTRVVAEVVLPRSVRELGVTPRRVEQAGVTPVGLVNGTVSADQLREAGLTTETLAEALLPPELVEHGITPERIGEAVTLEELFAGDVGAADLREAGLTTETIADALLPASFRSAGITPERLEEAGITPAAVLNGEVTPADVADAGITPETLADAGVLPDAVADVGAAIDDLLASGLDPTELLDRGFDPGTLVDVGVDPKRLLDAGIGHGRLLSSGVDAVALASKGLATAEDLLQAGASPAELARVGAAVETVVGGDVPVSELVRAGFKAAELLRAGADAAGIAKGGARPSDLRAAGVDAGTLRDSGRNAGSLRLAGYTAEELLDAGYSTQELLEGGFTPEALADAGVPHDEIDATGRPPGELLAAGYPPAELLAAGYGPDQLLEAGLGVPALLAAGYTAGELRDAGIETERLVAAGVDPGDLRAAGADTGALVSAGADPGDLRAAGVTAEELLDHGLEPRTLLEAGFASVELEVAGVDVDRLAETVSEGSADTGAVVDAATEGLQYAASVLESLEQAERDLYSFSFDPAVPSLRQRPDRSAGGDRTAVDDEESGRVDGGTASVPVARALAVDDSLPTKIERWVEHVRWVFDEYASDLTPGDDAGALLDLLSREALSRDVRRQSMAYSGEEIGWHNDWNAATRGIAMPEYRLAFDVAVPDDADPRRAYFFTTDAADGADLPWSIDGVSSETRRWFFREHRRRQGSPVASADLVDDDIGRFVDVLLGAGIDDVGGLTRTIYPEELSPETDPLGDVEWGTLSPVEKRVAIVDGIESATDPVAFAKRLVNGKDVEYDQGGLKIELLAANQAEYGDTGVLRSMARLLLQFGTVHAYVSARRRLGQAYGDPPAAWPEPAYYRRSDDEPTSALYDTAPEALRSHPNVAPVDSEVERIDYRHVLETAAADYPSSTSLDPRLSEFTDSLRYLGDIDPDRLSTLVRETLDVCSHRVDAWWTSLATKRLFELREAQGTTDPESGPDSVTWNGVSSDVPRATVDPALLSSLDLDGGVGRSGGTEDKTGIRSDGGPENGDRTGSKDGGQSGEEGDDDGSVWSGSDAMTTGPLGSTPPTGTDFDPAAIADLTIDPTVGGPGGPGQVTTDDHGVGPSSDGRAVQGTPPDGPGSERSSSAPEGGEHAPDDQGGARQGGTSDDTVQGRGDADTVSVDTLRSEGAVAGRGSVAESPPIADRAADSPGLYVGAYGFVEGLSVDDGDDSTPEYVHAPSRKHATTAAVVHSGYEAHERDGDTTENVMGVDLSPDRVRAGLRLIRGVRRGQSLGELLGYRFERRLREKTLRSESNPMQYVDAFRAALPIERIERQDGRTDPTADDRREELPDPTVVDGWTLVDEWERYPFGRDDLPDRGTDVYDAIVDVVEELRDDVDATGDLLTAESVHQLAQGNYDRAGGSVDALARGEPLPDPEIARTPRSETGQMHRQCLLFGTHTAGEGATPRTRAEPALAAWVETLLPDDDDVECRATYRWEAPTDVERTTSVRLSDLSLGPLDVLLLFGADRQAARSELERRLAYRLLRNRPEEVPVDARIELDLTETANADTVSMADLLELARGLRDLVGESRPATAADLAHPSEPRDEGYDETTVRELTRRANRAQGRLLEVAGRIDERLAVLDPGHDRGDGIGELSELRATGDDDHEADDDTVPTGTPGEGRDDQPQRERDPDAEGTDTPGSWDHLSSGVMLPGDGSPVAENALDAAASTVTEQVATVADAVGAVENSVPLSTAESVTGEIDPGVLSEQLSTVADLLPAGPTSPAAVTGEHVVPAAPDASIQGVLGEPTSVPDPEAVRTSVTVETDLGSEGGHGDDGRPSDVASIDTASIRDGLPGTGGTDGETVDMRSLPEVDHLGPARYADSLEGVTLSEDPPEGTTSSTRRTDATEDLDTFANWAGTTATVRLWGTDGRSWLQRSTTVDPDPDGSFDVSFDLSGVEPGTPFTAVATVDDAVVYSATGRVVAAGERREETVPAVGSALTDDCPTIGRLLWLNDRHPRFDPGSGAAADLAGALGSLDRDAVRRERRAATPEMSTVSDDDLAAVDAVLDLEELDLSALNEEVGRVTDPVARLGLDRVVDVIGDGSPDEVGFSYAAIPGVGRVRTRIERAVENPSLYETGAGPRLLAYHHDTAETLYSLDHGEAIAAYVDAFLSDSGWIVRYLDGTVRDPAGLVRDLTAWLYDPEQLTSTDRLADRLYDLAAVVSDLPALARTFDGLPTLEGRTPLETCRAHLERLAAAIERGPSSSDPADVGATLGDDLTAAIDDFRATVGDAAERVATVAGASADRAFRNLVLERLRDPMTVAASYGVFGGTPGSADGGRPEDERELVEQARGLLQRLRSRLVEASALDPRVESVPENRPVAQRVTNQTDRLETLFGDGFTVLPPFSPTNGAELAVTFTDDALVPDDRHAAAEAWLQRTAEVRETVAGFREARSYAEAIAGTLTPQLTIGQIPYEPGDTWIGAEGVDPVAGKLSLVAQFGPGVTPATVEDRVTGLFVDEWTERVPDETETTGVALQYDDPGNRAPQSILVATPPDDGTWSLDDLAATVAETTEYVRQRALDLGDMGDRSLYQLFPALFLPHNEDDSLPRPPDVPLEMLEWYGGGALTTETPSEPIAVGSTARSLFDRDEEGSTDG